MGQKNYSIVVVEDDEVIRTLIKEILNKEHIEVSAISNIDSAIDLISSWKFDCILLDINLNGANGGLVIQDVKEDVESPNKNTPIIVMSGMITDDFEKNIKAKVSGILKKPFTADELIQVLEKADIQLSL
jgi:CheY-like chemotaxis protein